jgi:hypothetical protein
MLEPNEADVVEATLEWARKHGREGAALGLTRDESAEVWRLARLRALKRLLRELLLGEDRPASRPE